MNCTILVSAIRCSNQQLVAELEKVRLERAKMAKETMQLFDKEVAEMRKELEQLKLASGHTGEKLNPPPPPPNSPVANRRQMNNKTNGW